MRLSHSYTARIAEPVAGCPLVCNEPYGSDFHTGREVRGVNMLARVDVLDHDGRVCDRTRRHLKLDSYPSKGRRECVCDDSGCCSDLGRPGFVALLPVGYEHQRQFSGAGEAGWVPGTEPLYASNA